MFQCDFLKTYKTFEQIINTQDETFNKLMIER